MYNRCLVNENEMYSFLMMTVVMSKALNKETFCKSVILLLSRVVLRKLEPNQKKQYRHVEKLSRRYVKLQADMDFLTYRK